MTPENKNLQGFTDNFSSKHLKNEQTCFKGSLSYIDLLSSIENHTSETDG